jgi:hypothetical protein
VATDRTMLLPLERLACELEAVRCLLGRPASAAPLLRKSGLRVVHFAQDDLRLLYAAGMAAGKCRWGWQRMASFAARVLNHYGWLDPEAPHDQQGMCWSIDGLEALACEGAVGAWPDVLAVGKWLVALSEQETDDTATRIIRAARLVNYPTGMVVDYYRRRAG